MNDEREEVGEAKVYVTKKAIHNAVRNILANEMKLDPIEVRNEVRAKGFELIKTEVIDYLTKAGYGHAGLQDWAKRAMDSRIKDVDKILKEVVKEVVEKKIHDECVEVVEAIVTNGLEVRVGWNRKIKLTMKD